MFAKVKFTASIACAVIIIAFLITGCGKTKETLDLPEQEMKQLENIEKGGEEAQETSNELKQAMPKVGTKRVYVYADKGYFKNNFVPSGWMGDYGDLKFIDGWREDPYSRRTCIRVEYTAQRRQGAGWTGVYWQEPANNWGNLPGVLDLTGANSLTFYAKGEKGGELITEFKMGGIQGEFSDSTSVSIGPIVLTPEWQKHTIDLTGEDLSCVIGGFGFVISQMENPDGAIFYLDEIVYEE